MDPGGGVVDFRAPFIEVDGSSEDIASVDGFSVLVDVVSVLVITDRRVDTAGGRIRPATGVNSSPKVHPAEGRRTHRASERSSWAEEHPQFLYHSRVPGTLT